MKLLTLLALFVAAALALPPGVASADAGPAPESDHYHVDDRGRPMRVVFPLHDRVTFDAALGATEEVRGAGLGFALHHSAEVAYPEDEIWWRLRHRWLPTQATFRGDSPQLTMSLLSATYMRHATSSYIVIPSANHARLPAPFDIAFEYELFATTVDLQDRQVSSARVAEFAFLLDFLRDPTYRHRLAIGPLISYEIDRANGLHGVAHTFVPASGGRLSYRWESAPGRAALDTRLQCAAAATLADRELSWRPHCQLDLQAERTIFAINDRPLSLFVDAGLQGDPTSLGGPSTIPWRAQLGLRLSLPAAGRGSQTSG